MKNYKEKFLNPNNYARNNFTENYKQFLIIYKTVIIIRNIFFLFALCLETVTRMSYITDQFCRLNFVKLRH